jgi:hypothetical protein
MTSDEKSERGIRSFLDGKDPLSLDAMDWVIAHKEEDLFVDYKESFEPENEKHWLAITTDAMAFANTMGGYIVFGVTDTTFDVAGLSKEVVVALTDTNMVMQKLNRYVSPSFSAIRTRRYDTLSGESIVIMYVPESKGKTHMFIKDVSYRHPSGKTKQVIHAGMVFIRRSATNHVVEPEDLEFIINRRINYYKDSILDKIAKVVDAPVEHQVLIFDPSSKAPNGQKYVISDSPDAVPVKGMSFTVAPRTDVEELCGWISLSKRDPGFMPSSERLWHLYSVRNELQLNTEQTLELARFSLLSEMPVFFWLKLLSAQRIKPLLLRVFDATKSMHIKCDGLYVGAFLGNTFYTRMLKRFGDNAKRLGPSGTRFPEDPSEFFNQNLVRGEDRYDLEIRLTSIAEELTEGSDVIKKMRAKAIDCFLYARKDRYVGQ